jgi:NAD(P)-dependent dehydrogenase (short-subunit alcohol dehydrogenase family)
MHPPLPFPTLSYPNTLPPTNRTFNVNVLAQFNTLRAFLPSLLSRKQGHIITVSSLLGRPGASCAFTSDYAASKAALISLHSSLREELDFHHNAPLIRTTLLAPGLVQTPMFSGQRPLRENVRIIPGWLFDFLMPAVPVNAVVKEIIKALDLQESREIVMPEFAKTFALVPILPYWVTCYVKWVRVLFSVFLNGFTQVLNRSLVLKMLWLDFARRLD